MTNSLNEGFPTRPVNPYLNSGESAPVYGPAPTVDTSHQEVLYGYNNIPLSGGPRNKLAFKSFLFTIIYRAVMFVVGSIVAVIGFTSLTFDALASVATMVGVCLLADLIAGLISVITAHKALNQIRKSNESGKGYALWSVVLGYLSFPIPLLVFGFYFLAVIPAIMGLGV